jgi:hypothetical protein
MPYSTSSIREGSASRYFSVICQVPGVVSLSHIVVGSRTGAPTLGSGGCSAAFAVALSPAAMITFPAPAASNVACEFLALNVLEHI